MLNENCLVRPANANKKVRWSAPSTHLPEWVKKGLKAKASDLGEQYYVYGQEVVFPKFASKAEGEWFSYYWALEWNR